MRKNFKKYIVKTITTIAIIANLLLPTNALAATAKGHARATIYPTTNRVFVQQMKTQNLNPEENMKDKFRYVKTKKLAQTKYVTVTAF